MNLLISLACLLVVGVNWSSGSILLTRRGSTGLGGKAAAVIDSGSFLLSGSPAISGAPSSRASSELPGVAPPRSPPRSQSPTTPPGRNQERHPETPPRATNKVYRWGATRLRTSISKNPRETERAGSVMQLGYRPGTRSRSAPIQRGLSTGSHHSAGPAMMSEGRGNARTRLQSVSSPLRSPAKADPENVQAIQPQQQIPYMEMLNAFSRPVDPISVANIMHQYNLATNMNRIPFSASTSPSNREDGRA